MTAEYNPDADHAPQMSHDWDTLRAAVLTRDSYTCQRCGHTPSETLDGRVLHSHRLLTSRTEPAPPTELTSRYITLCRPCHGVQHPTDSTFDTDRPHAPVVPSYHAHPEVALINRKHPDHDPVDEAIWLRHRVFDRDEYICQRCNDHGVSPHGDMPGEKLTAYVVDRPLDYGFTSVRKMLSLCRPCYRLVQGDVDTTEFDTTDRLLPHTGAHPEVAAPRPPQNEDEEERVRQFLFEFCFERDSQSCQRCRTRITARSSEYPHEFASLYTPHEGASETFNPSDYLLLCSPCYSTLNPHDKRTQKFLPYAQQHPDKTAHPWVDSEKSHYRPEDLQTLNSETIRNVFETHSHQCQRCTSRQLPEDNLVAYPEFDTTTDVVEDPFEQYITLCRPCASVIHHNGDDSTTLADLHALEPLSEDSFERAAEGAKPTPTYPILHELVDVEREAVNRKERLLLSSGLRRVHMAWKLGGTISIATGLFFFILSNLMWIDRSMISLPLTGWTATPWLAVTGAVTLFALFAASTIRWTIADITGRLWAKVDSTIESHHYRVDAPHEWRRTLEAYAYLFGAPYIVLVIGHILFLTILTIHWLVA